MTASLGSLVVSLGLSAGEYTAGLDKATYQAKVFADTLNKQFKELSTALGGYFSAAIFVDMIKGTIEAKARLVDLSTQTGISVESLSGLSNIAKLSGTSLDDIASASNKLSKALFGQNEDSKGAAQGIKALGLNFDAFKKLAPDQQLIAVAKAMDGFQDGTGKGAVAMELFGKAGAQQLPFLRDLATATELTGTQTTASALEAKKFEDNLVKLKIAGDEWKRQLVEQMLPSLITFTDQMTQAKTIGEKFAVILGNIKDNTGFSAISSQRKDLENLNQAVSRASLGLDLFLAIQKRLPGEGGPFAAVVTQQRKELEDLMKQALAASAALKGVADVASPRDTGPTDTRHFPPKPKLPDPVDNTEAEAALKKTLDGQLQAIKDNLKQQQDAIAFSNKYLAGEYQDGVLSLADTFAVQATLRQKDIADQLAAQGKIIADERAFAAKTTDPQKRIDAANAIAHAQAARTEIIVKGQQEEALAVQANDRAVLALKDRYDDLRASTLSLSGDDAGAAQIKIAQQIRAAQILVNQSGPPAPAAQATVDAFARALANTEALAEAQKVYQDLLLKTQNAEETLYLDAAAGSKGEVETLAALRDSRTAALAQLSAMNDLYIALAANDPSPAAQKAADAMTLAYKKAQAQIDPLAQKFNATFEDSFSGAFEGFIAGTKTASQAFRDFASNVVSGLAKIAAQDLAKSIFGGASGQGGIGALLSSYFGSIGGATTQGGPTQGIDFSGTGFPAAQGIAQVPYDGFMASLHKGEAVVPAAYNPRNAGGGGNIYINNTAAGVANASASRDDQGDFHVLVEAAADAAHNRVAADVGSGTGRVAAALKARGLSLSGGIQRRG